MNDKNIQEDSLVVTMTVAQLSALLAETLSLTSPPVEAEPEMIDIKQVSKLTGYSVKTLYKFVGKREIPFHKPYRKLFFITAEIYEWMKTNRVETNDEFVAAHKAGKTQKVKRSITSKEVQEIRDKIKQMRGLLEFMQSDEFMDRIRTATTPSADLFLEPVTEPEN